MDLRGKWMLVTGASSGLGREIARRLAYDEGVNLIISARRVERLLLLKEEIQSRTISKVEVIQADLGNEEEIE